MTYMKSTLNSYQVNTTKIENNNIKNNIDSNI